ncbi:methyltranfer_dom domain-containing protein [Trichonephila clavipes]|nr:methyltranfer_dom domain-containing protein [Trichonephila clavipes]
MLLIRNYFYFQKANIESMDPILYSKYHHLQERDVNDFLLACASFSNWCNLTKKIVMDVGCGSGNTSCAWFLSLFLQVKRLIAIDKSEEMIKLAKVLNPHPKIEYMVADIADESSLECWEGTIHKVISTWCFQFIADKRKAFRNVYNLLKPGGEAAILFEVDSPYHQCYRCIIERPKWSHIFKSRSLEYPQIYSENSSDVYYKRLLQELGFTVVLCKKKQKTFAFSSDEDCIGFLLSVFSLYKMVPDECMEEFRNDLLESFLLYGGREASGRPVVYYNLMNVLVKRPNQTT